MLHEAAPLDVLEELKACNLLCGALFLLPPVFSRCCLVL